MPSLVCSFSSHFSCPMLGFPISCHLGFHRIVYRSILTMFSDAGAVLFLLGIYSLIFTTDLQIEKQITVINVSITTRRQSMHQPVVIAQNNIQQKPQHSSTKHNKLWQFWVHKAKRKKKWRKKNSWVDSFYLHPLATSSLGHLVCLVCNYKPSTGVKLSWIEWPTHSSNAKMTTRKKWKKKTLQILQMAERQRMHLMKSRTAPIKLWNKEKTALQLNDCKNLNWILP